MARNPFDQRIYPYPRINPAFGQFPFGFGFLGVPRPPFGEQLLQRAYQCPTFPPQIAVETRSSTCSCQDCTSRMLRSFGESDDDHFAHDHEQCDDSQVAWRLQNSEGNLKDIVVRGRAYSIRASYLLDQPKFEKELAMVMEKKSEEEVPNRVVNMLFAFINQEKYCNFDPLDEVTLCILANNIGAKSVVEHSLSQMKKIEDYVEEANITKIIITIMLSSKVPAKLVAWLQKYLKEEDRWVSVYSIPDFHFKVKVDRPGLFLDVERLLNHLPEEDKEGLRFI